MAGAAASPISPTRVEGEHKKGDDEMKTKWMARILTSKKHGIFSMNDIRDASCWGICAIGENRKKLERLGIEFSSNGIPFNNYLVDEGFSFFKAIRDNNPKLAINLLKNIKNFTNKKENVQ